MPQLFIHYTPNLDAKTDMPELCRKLAAALQTVRDEAGQQVLPTGGIRVMAFPATHYAVADSSGDFGFCYLNLRMGRGRSAATQQRAGQTITDVAKEHFAPLLARKHLGITLQVDEGQEVFDAKIGNLHPLFTPKKP